MEAKGGGGSGSSGEPLIKNDCAARAGLRFSVRKEEEEVAVVN